MSATIITDTDYQAFIDPNGNTLIFSFEEIHELKPWPPALKWRMVHAGRIDDTIRHIGRRCADIEDDAIRLGAKRLGDRMNLSATPDSQFFAEKQLAALRRQLPLITLPETVTVTDRSDDLWQWSDFDSPIDMRRQFMRQFGHLMESAGIRTDDGWTVRVDQNIDLLLKLDDFAWGWHDAWPDKRMSSDSGVTPLGAAIYYGRGDNRPPEMSVMKIDGFQDLFLIEHIDSPFYPDISCSPLKIRNGSGTIRDYWNNHFPSAALHHSWGEDLRQIRRRLSPSNTDTAASINTITITKPHDAPSSVMDIWRECAGDNDEIRLADAVRILNEISWNNAEWKTEHLVKFCGSSIGPTDLTIDDGDACGPR